MKVSIEELTDLLTPLYSKFDLKERLGVLRDDVKAKIESLDPDKSRRVGRTARIFSCAITTLAAQAILKASSIPYTPKNFTEYLIISTLKDFSLAFFTYVGLDCGMTATTGIYMPIRGYIYKELKKRFHSK